MNSREDLAVPLAEIFPSNLTFSFQYRNTYNLVALGRVGIELQLPLEQPGCHFPLKWE